MVSIFRHLAQGIECEFMFYTANFSTIAVGKVYSMS